MGKVGGEDVLPREVIATLVSKGVRCRQCRGGFSKQKEQYPDSGI